ncbi:MAG: hypothetical protein IKU18_02580 [Bacteroidales bacterium]|nr:hypothetical protein [Bacteroidales bacterium]
MRKLSLILFALLALVSGQAFGQDPVSYFMEGSSFRMQWNPAFAPNKGFVNIPFVGSIQASVAGNTSFNNIAVLQDGKYNSIFDKNVPASLALANLNEMNTTGASVRVGTVNFGSYTKNKQNFWAVDIGTRFNLDARLPYGFVDFMKNGKSGNANNLGLSLESYYELGFSYSMPITDELYVGARVKALVGLMRMGINFDKLEIEKNSDSWLADVVGRFEMSGIVPPTVQSEITGELIYDIGDLTDDLTENLKIPAGYGAAIDFGATYDLLPNLQLSASVNDLGFMTWSKNATSIGVATKKLHFSGSTNPDDYNSGYLPDVDAEDFEFEVVNNEGGARMLQASVNLGAQYRLLNNKIGVGLFYNMKFQEYRQDHNITLSANFRPLNWLHVSGCYSLINNQAHAVGLGLNICPGFINLFAATDILLSKKVEGFIPLEQNNMNLTFGLGIPLGKRGER